MLPMPWSNRRSIIQRNSKIRPITGGVLVDEFVGGVPMRADCSATGVLAATWDPATIGRVSFVTHANDINFAFRWGRLDVAAGSVTEVHRQAAAAACTNLGGASASRPPALSSSGWAT